jgi:fluoroquinolone transport system ATP-binding protein
MPPAVPPTIAVRDLSFTYPGAARHAVSDLDFSVGEGEVVGFLGPNGAGKSTTQKILIGLLRGYSGRVTVLGRPLPDWGADYYERIGVSFERPNHFLKLTAAENLGYFRSLYSGDTEDVFTALDLVGLGGDADRRVAHFSKGMQVRLNVARALINRPRLLFLDEPTAGLDPVNADVVRGLVRRLRDAGTTVFLTTHDMALADSVCDRVAFLVDARIALIDSPRALKLRHGVRAVRAEYGSDGRTERAEFPLPGIADNPAFLGLLRRDDLQTLHTQETTLEAIFIEVTGRGLA